MRHNIHLITLAVLVALALAAVSGALLPSDNVVYAADPGFVDGAGTRSVPENTPPGVNIGVPISATDADEGTEEFGQTLTYSLRASADTAEARADAASFDIDPSTGQLITKAALNFEAKASYSVTVGVDDGETRAADLPCTTCTQAVEITVTDDTGEFPAAPAPPTVVSYDDPETTDVDESTMSLKVIWHAPENTGDDITEYDVRYKKSTDASFSDDDHTGTATFATIMDLDADTSYHVRVQAMNGEGIGPWSLVGTGSTNKAGNGVPRFGEDGEGGAGVLTREVDENEPARERVGHEVRADPANDDGTLTYRLEGPDADLFDLNTSSGQIRTKGLLNHEDPRCYDASTPDNTQCVYNVTVAVFDGAGGSDARQVRIEVGDELETPGVPARPTVRATERDGRKNNRSLDVSWKEPENTGPPITGYDIRYRAGRAGTYRMIENITRTSATIAPVDDTGTDDDDRLKPDTSYEVHVRAENGERIGNWSPLATGRTSVGSQQPKFTIRPGNEDRKVARIISLMVNENTRAGQSLGTVRARGATPTYKLVAETLGNSDSEAVVAKFDINESTGQILTEEPLNHESDDCDYDEMDSPTVCVYTVQVEVRDGFDEDGNKEEGNPADDTAAEARVDDRIMVEITVRDVREAPAKPVVTVTSPTGGTTLNVDWDEPENTGPPITGYEVECTGDGITAAGQCPAGAVADAAVAVLTSEIRGLTAGKSYRVRVRATRVDGHDEGNGTWSSVVSQSTSKTVDGVANNAPTVADPGDLRLNENNRSVEEVGSVVNATDPDQTGGLTYRLEGPGAGLFTIDGRGQIKTRSSLNFEDPKCGYTVTSPMCTYTVRVKVSDRHGGSDAVRVDIAVRDDDREAPIRPATPRVTATKDSGRSLEVTWTEPKNKGPAITDYDIKYRKYRRGTDTDDWEQWDHEGTEREATIKTIPKNADGADVSLEPRTEYEVQVRAKNGEADDVLNWSPSGRGRTGESNKRPVFTNKDTLVKLRVDENTRAGQNVGDPIEATDADRNRLTYRLEGPGKDSFTIVSSSGQIRTRAALDYESRRSYSLTVKADDGKKKTNSVAAKSVTIGIDDVVERPLAPAAPRVSGIRGSTNSVLVTWDEPKNTGSSITSYDLQYRASGDAGFSEWYHDGVDMSAIITGLTPGKRYEVQVRARNEDGGSEGPGPYSRSGTGSPNPDVANQKPVFSPSGARTFTIEENTVEAGGPIGAPVTAVDPDLDTVTHTLEGTDATSFTIDVGSGQIRASAALNYEEKSRYSVTVKATDTRGGSATVRVTIAVTDVDEPPDTPLSPTVTAVSSTSLQVSWEAPENTGPPITDYDYRYRDASVQVWTEVTNTPITATSVTIEGLTPSTSYDAEVRAKNAEGTSDWSNPGIGSTNAPGANNLPVFADGTSATRSVSAAAAAGASIGEPVAATDADNDTLTYSLEGRDAPSFDINDATGQLLTRSGIPLIVGTTYTVTVVADDTKDTARITVSIEATAAPPNNPPVFSGGPRSFSVREGTTAGTNIGSPVRATDADGDTLTYTLEGTDASSFNIRSNTGQIVSRAALDADTKSTYTVTVAASDGKAGRATVAVTITVTPRPTTFGCATRGAVLDASNTGLVSDCEALLAARDVLVGSGRRLNWSASTPIAQWNGVILDEGTPMRVATLNLRKMRLRGMISSDLSRVTALRELYLQNNHLTGPIPSELGSLTALTHLYADDNDLSGAIPSQLGDLTALEQLRLSSNDLSGPLPAALGSLTNLTHLLLSDNDLSGSIPSRIGGMSSLQWLDVGQNSIEGTLPAALGNLAQLRRLYIYENDLTGSIPSTLGNLTRLTHIVAQENDLSGSIPAQLGNMSALVWMGLYDNDLSGAIPSQLGRLSNLQRLYLSKNDLTGTIPTALGDLSALTNLWLNDNGLSGTIPSELDRLDDLVRWRLRDNDFTGCVPAGLAEVRSTDLVQLGLPVCSGS